MQAPITPAIDDEQWTTELFWRKKHRMSSECGH